MDAKARAEADAKAKAEAAAKAKADAEAKAKAEKEAAVKAAAERQAAEDTLRQKRAAEREKMATERAAGEGAKVIPMTPAAEQKSEADKIIEKLNWVHRRVKLY